jgi:hypothetical protein
MHRILDITNRFQWIQWEFLLDSMGIPLDLMGIPLDSIGIFL